LFNARNLSAIAVVDFSSPYMTRVLRQKTRQTRANTALFSHHPHAAWLR
jgi:hypothetical protein